MDFFEGIPEVEESVFSGEFCLFRLVFTTYLSIVYVFSQHLINVAQSEIESLLVDVPNKQYLGQYYHLPSAFSPRFKIWRLML